jgi:hypothetical protein
MAGRGRPKGQGKTPGSGRKKGTTNGDVAKLREIILGALDQGGGQQWLVQQMTDNPSAFLSLIGRVLPKDVNVGGQPENPIITKIELVPLSDSSPNSATK